MSPLNSIIKSVFLCGEALLLLASLIIGIAAAVLLSGRVFVLRYPLSQSLCWSIAILAFCMCLCTVYACIGAHRQIKRGSCCWSGRRMLCAHQVALICAAIYCSKETYSLHQRQTSIEHTLATMTNISSAIPYDDFERKLSAVFNEDYYQLSSCNNTTTTTNGNKVNSFIETWVQRNCPSSIKESCPKRSQCLVGEKLKECPYEYCRESILGDLNRLLISMVRVLIVLSSLSTAILVLSCLLICYNPRDAIEIELFKTGVMTEEDVELIRRLRSEQKFDYGNSGGGNRKGSSSVNNSFIDLDSLRKSAIHSIAT